MFGMITTVILLIVGVTVSFATAQTPDAERALARLQRQSQEAMEQGDPQGAAISIGRAALLASQLDKQRTSAANRPPYRLMVDLFRTQEQVYRAMALFQQGGERPPASSGTCTLLALGRQRATQALEHKTPMAGGASLHESLQRQTTEWLEIVKELEQEWECR